MYAIRSYYAGISNRRHFDEHAERAFSFATRDNLPFSVLMIDLDYFKLFNDIDGHQRGDDVLRLVANRITSYNVCYTKLLR